MTRSSAAAKRPSGGLPPGLLIRLGRLVWTTLWRAMMARLAPSDRTGAYVRPAGQFRGVIGAHGPYPPEAGRYRLYVGLGCPWAHRTLVVRALKGLEEAIGVSVVQPSPEAGGWVLERPEEGCRSLAQLYALARPGYTGRATVPVLWDTRTRAIVNNESAEIIVILDGEFNEFARRPDLELYPAELRETIDRWNEKTYHSVNNGVYRCGFAQTQEAYDRAIEELFTALDTLDAALETRRYLCGERVTLADVRLFTTLFRFDIAYHGLFKCNRRRIRDYRNLGAYLRDLYQLAGVAGTCDAESVKRDYYGNLFPLNPGGIVPAGPDPANLNEPHGRERLGALAGGLDEIA
ncbi:glutathione S-transferase family protein [Gloeobacter violaceus]|uniref:Gll1700 protein n=1 Tax=Gloeobacter violaceus (strain ATCC 29082 / PCC 7421) TaxID=251221 RepID=Q7NJY1_GLOVI|nr:glutathione S-transferase family protein [Gloeobacter violaceus]BAC89641.1 gll1700 [Gloeobacter violaceus PCC 7421]